MIGRVYKLKCGDKFYIGSTAQKLNDRLRTHKYHAKKNKLPFYKYFNEQGWDAITIELLEEGEFENRKALYEREGEYILPCINDEKCLNCRVAGRNHKESYKIWYDTHNKTYREIHKEKINARRRVKYAMKREAERWVYKFLD